MPMGDDDLGRVLADMLAASHRTAPREISVLVQRTGRRLGLSQACVYVADLQQRDLIALPTPEQARQLALGRSAEGPETLSVDATLGGRAYRTETVQTAPADGSSGRVVWFPLMDGIGRIGVMRVVATTLGPTLLDRCEALATVTAMLLAAKQTYSDVLAQTMRSRPMSLQAELVWAFLPPRTIGTAAVTSTALLEPAYDAGGDAYDHSLAGDLLHLTLLDAMGHDLASGGCSAVALAACRSSRRGGGSLTDIAEEIDRSLERWIPERLLTCVVADLDTGTGRLDWINCGHPAPLLIRDGRIVTGALERPAHLPLGLAGHGAPPPQVHSVDLQPGDRVLLFTDGITEARSSTGELFGDQRLADTVVRAMADGLPAPEILRRVVKRVALHQDQQRDDATVLLAEWHPER